MEDMFESEDMYEFGSILPLHAPDDTYQYAPGSLGSPGSTFLGDKSPMSSGFQIPSFAPGYKDSHLTPHVRTNESNYRGQHGLTETERDTVGVSGLNSDHDERRRHITRRLRQMSLDDGEFMGLSEDNTRQQETPTHRDGLPQTAYPKPDDAGPSLPRREEQHQDYRGRGIYQPQDTSGPGPTSIMRNPEVTLEDEMLIRDLNAATIEIRRRYRQPRCLIQTSSEYGRWHFIPGGGFTRI